MIITQRRSSTCGEPALMTFFRRGLPAPVAKLVCTCTRRALVEDFDHDQLVCEICGACVSRSEAAMAIGSVVGQLQEMQLMLGEGDADSVGNGDGEPQEGQASGGGKGKRTAA